MLLPHRRASGPIIGRNFDRALLEVRRASGITPWPVDCLRHSFASYWLAVNKNRAELAEIHGNSVGIIKKHYRRPIAETVAAEYWALSLEPAEVISIAG
jgi:hypothetical protein